MGGVRNRPVRLKAAAHQVCRWQPGDSLEDPATPCPRLSRTGTQTVNVYCYYQTVNVYYYS